MFLLVAAAVAFTLAGCGSPSIDDRVSTSSEVGEARAVLDDLARADVVAVAARLDESQFGPNAATTLRQLAGLFPNVAPTRVRVVGFDQRTMSIVGGTTTETSQVIFESNYPAANVLSQVAFRRVDHGKLSIVGLHVQPLPAPLAVLNAFTFSGKGAVQYGSLVIMAGIAAVTLVALVVWFRRGRSIRHRWGWLAAILVGVTTTTVNWTTGATAVKPVMVQPLSLACWRPGIDAPWMLGFSIPAGAIAFLIRQRRATKPRVTSASPLAGG